MRSSRPSTSYVHFTELTTRWMDNDAYGHINNVMYYSFFDTAVTEHLICGGLPRHSKQRHYRARRRNWLPVLQARRLSGRLVGGLRVAKLGNSSVRYEIGIFLKGDGNAAAEGHFVHVYVDRALGKPVPIP